MSAKIVQLRDAVVAAINAQEFAGMQPSAEGTYGSQIDLEAIESLVVRVAMGALESERVTRLNWVERPRLDIGVGKKLTGTEAEKTDQANTLIEFCESMKAFIRDQAIQGDDFKAVCVGVATETLFDPAVFVQRGEFQSVLSLTYQLG